MTDTTPAGPPGVTRPAEPPGLPDVFRGSAAVRQGLITRKQLRNRDLVRPVLYDAYRRTHVELTHLVKCRAAALVVPRGSVLTGRSLATVWGTDLARTEDDVTLVALARPGSRRRGVAVRVASTGPLHHGEWHGLPTATPHRMAFDLAARLPREDAVAALDVVARAGLIGLERFGAWLAGRHDDDVVAVRAAVRLCDARAESPPESVCRVRLALAGFHAVPQHVVRDARGFVARVDLALVELRIAVEYDGAWHGDGRQVARDRERLNRLREAGWIVVHVTAATLREDGALVALVAGAVAQRRAGR